jgi:uncharacterized protein (DUF1697 family)
VPRHVALLRGINVGGKHRVAMVDLVAQFQALGARDVTTYIQSGNVLFDAPARLVAGLPRAATQALLDRFGFEIPVVIRSADELAAVVDASPHADAPEDQRHVAFLAAAPTAAAAAKLDPARSPPDAFVLRGRELFLCLPNGVARTKLTCAYVDRVLATTSTMRNWRTTVTLRDLLTR